MKEQVAAINEKLQEINHEYFVLPAQTYIMLFVHTCAHVG